MPVVHQFLEFYHPINWEVLGALSKCFAPFLADSIDALCNMWMVRSHINSVDGV